MKITKILQQQAEELEKLLNMTPYEVFVKHSLSGKTLEESLLDNNKQHEN